MPGQAVGEGGLAVSRSHTTDAALRLRCNTTRRWDPGFARGRWVADPAFRCYRQQAVPRSRRKLKWQGPSVVRLVDAVSYQTN